MGTINTSPETDARLQLLTERCGMDTETELVNLALSILEWAVSEVSQGSEIAAINQLKRYTRTLASPQLNAIAAQAVKPARPKLSVVPKDPLE